ncbi:hypothetical protein E2C01_080803 [Portunus trituberculatus]|uniref:Uncharacterized protein n=1 Tax=Portunus trituberculatus TaxID=210409 RepID=A0A5B7IUC5_PORTR|nr:hypothetical protein [Portunus trituberculatus]
MWKIELLNVPQTLTFSPSSVSDIRFCLSIFFIWFTNLKLCHTTTFPSTFSVNFLKTNNFCLHSSSYTSLLLPLSHSSTVSKHACPFSPSKPLLFLASNALYEKLFRQLYPLRNNRAAHLSQLLLGSSALEYWSPREM